MSAIAGVSKPADPATASAAVATAADASSWKLAVPETSAPPSVI
jgi:hypothetical protein